MLQNQIQYTFRNKKDLMKNQNRPRQKKTILLWNFFLLSFFALSQNVSYTESFEDFMNPDRGFYTPINGVTSNFIPLSASHLQSLRENAFTPWQGNYQVRTSIILRHYILDMFVDEDNLSTSFLNNVQADFDAARQAGVRLVLRFSYTITPNGGNCGSWICPPYGDAPKARVLSHIAQLKPYLQANDDVILAVQQGFIGVWGEQYYTDYFGDASVQNKLTNQNWQDRLDVLAALLDAVPQNRMVQVRYPQIKQKYIYGIDAPVTAAPMTATQAHDGSDIARIGFHNDCFLSGTDDQGTYWDYGSDDSFASNQTAILKPYAAADGQYTSIGGETCSDAFSPENNCTGQAVSDMDLLHYTYLNSDYNNAVNNDWETDGCMDEIKRRLGYRFVMQDGTFPDSVSSGQAIHFILNIENMGFTAPFNERRIHFVIKNTQSGEVYPLDITGTNTDTRFWHPDNTIILNGMVTLPSGIPDGDYDTFLHIYDPSNNNLISNRVDYSIRMANENTWDATTGYNSLNHQIHIGCNSINYLLSGALDSNQNYETNGIIQSTQMITNDATAIYNSNVSILLDAGFSVDIGAMFHGFIEGCE